MQFAKATVEMTKTADESASSEHYEPTVCKKIRVKHYNKNVTEL